MKLRLAGMKISLRVPDDLNTSLTMGKHNLFILFIYLFNLYLTTVQFISNIKTICTIKNLKPSIDKTM